MLLSVCALAAGASLQPSPKPALPTRSSLLELRGGASLKQQLKEEISVKGAPPPSAVGGSRQPRLSRISASSSAHRSSPSAALQRLSTLLASSPSEDARSV